MKREAASDGEPAEKRKAGMASPATSVEEEEPRLKFAVVCSSNMNRSMEAHRVLKKQGFSIESYGTGSCVKLPGPAIDKPNVYQFGQSTYEYMFKDLKQQNEQLYIKNGVLDMLERNMHIKPMPEKFQKETQKKFDVILTCENRIFDEALRDLEERPRTDGMKPVHVIDLDIKDNHDSATIGAILLAKLAAKLEQAQDLDDEIDDIVESFEKESGKALLHAVSFY